MYMAYLSLFALQPAKHLEWLIKIYAFNFIYIFWQKHAENMYMLMCKVNKVIRLYSLHSFAQRKLENSISRALWNQIIVFPKIRLIFF